MNYHKKVILNNKEALDEPSDNAEYHLWLYLIVFRFQGTVLCLAPCA